MDIIPVAIAYSFGKMPSLFVKVGDSINTEIFSLDNESEYRDKVNMLTRQLHFEVSELLTSTKTLFNSSPNYVSV